MRKISCIGLVAPSGNIKNTDELNKKISLLEKDFKVKKFFSENYTQHYLSDTDANRAKYFESAFCDDEVDLVLSVRGGYGAIRIVDKINYKKINTNKYYASSSDGSILLASLSKKTNTKCFHSLMMTNGFVENLKNNINIIENEIFNINLKQLNSTKTKPQGYLWGGNLSSIVCLLGDENYLPEKDIVLFIEDLNEPPYKIDKMLYELYRKTSLKEKIKAVIFGDFYLEDEEASHIFDDFSKLFNVNCYHTKDITHKINNVTIPYFKKVVLPY